MKLGGVYLTFNGDCHKAMTFYSKVFGKKIDMAMTWADGKDGGMLPKEMQDSKVDDAKDRMMHMSLMLDDTTSLMACDTHPMMHKDPFQPGNNYQIALEPSTKQEADSLYAALADGGKDGMPMQDMWWGSYHGSCVDQFGIRWMIDMATPKEQEEQQLIQTAAKNLRDVAKTSTEAAEKLEAWLEGQPEPKKAKTTKDNV